MPMAIPLVASAFSISAGLTAGGLVGGLMVAGGALGGLGAITGNKKLTVLGSVLGLAGGVGNMLGGAAKEVAAQGVGDAASKAASDAAKATAGNTVADATGTAVGASEAARTAATSVAEADQGLINQALSGGGQAAPGATQVAGGDAYGPGSGWGGDTLSKMGAANDTAPGLVDRAIGAVNNAIPGAGSAMKSFWDTGTGALKDVSSWAQANPETAKLAGGLVGGAMNYMGNQQIADDNIKRQMKYQDWVRQRYSDSVANLRVPAPFSTPQGSGGIIAASRG